MFIILSLLIGQFFLQILHSIHLLKSIFGYKNPSVSGSIVIAFLGHKFLHRPHPIHLLLEHIFTLSWKIILSIILSNTLDESSIILGIIFSNLFFISCLFSSKNLKPFINLSVLIISLLIT